MDRKIEILLAKYFSKTLNEVEKMEVDAWVLESDENQKIFDHYQQLWVKAEAFSSYSDHQVEEALHQTKKQMPQFSTRRRHLIWIRQVAAVIVLAIGLASVFQYFIQTDTVKRGVVFKEVVASRGSKTKLILPDGSSAQLYPGSKLIFPLAFSGENREVQLTGEGYFEVEHDAAMPFIVKTDQLNVKVLGTEFNVRAYEDEDFVETVLVNGKVALEKRENGKMVSLQTLKPNQRSVYLLSSGKLTVSDELDLHKYVDWRKGLLVFDADPMQEVVRKMENWYNIDFVVDDHLQRYKFTGVFEDEPIGEVLALMQYSSPFEYKIEKGHVDDTGAHVRKKIILTYKN